MFLPVQNKPESFGGYINEMVCMPNLIDRELAHQLKKFALDVELSGWHRRGSKTPTYVHASFNTCLVFPHNSPIYEVLDNAWNEYRNARESNITFIEPYEIKSYTQGDQFSVHNDILVSCDDGCERKINLVIQLSENEEYEGGDLYVGTNKCPRELGTGIFFPAKYLHHVTEITRGERFSLIGHAWGPISR